jgi:arylsulfatase A-like enzyme
VFGAARWEDQPNEFGVRGQIASDLGRPVGQGTHTTMSPFDFHNTLIASGPDFRHGWSDELPTGNIDVAPTILWLLGLSAPQALDGRVLKEALTTSANTPTVSTGTLTAEHQLEGSTWRQTVRTATVEKTTYFMEGNGGTVKSAAPSPNESHGDKAPHTPGRSDWR